MASVEGVPGLQTMSGMTLIYPTEPPHFTLTWPSEGIIDNPAEHVTMVSQNHNLIEEDKSTLESLVRRFTQMAMDTRER